MHNICYNQPGAFGHVLGPITIQTAETEIFKSVDGNHLRKSQLTMFWNVALGSATSVKLRYYYTPDNGATWFQVPLKTTSTGVLSDTPSVINSTSPAQGANSLLVEDIPFSGSMGFRVTAQAVAATAVLNSLDVFTRDN